MSEKTYKTTIGLEVHAELKTKTKMFCSCKNDTEEERPNVNICPICMAHPGTLPVINKQAVKNVLKVGLAIKAKLADFTEFDRKNYFYPDIPKGYQISQYKYPLVSGGELAGVLVTRVHLEEDTAKSSHETGDCSLVDFNRAGVPLMELVTEPVIHDAKTAGKFAQELQLLLRYLGVSDANMEKGEMRVEANISVSDTEKLGTKVEVKNLNSFRSVEKAIEYEVKRHIDTIESGEKIIQETCGWDEAKQKTFSQRKKEDSHDYRYFPDPDLPKLKISELSEFSEKALRSEMQELPEEKRVRYVKDFGIKATDIEFFVTNRAFGDFFEKTAVLLCGDKESIVSAANYLSSDVMGLVKNDTKVISTEAVLFAFSPADYASLIALIRKGDISSRGAKDILAIMYTDGGKADDIAKAKGLIQKSDAGELKNIALGIIAANEKIAAEFKAGKEASLQFLIGQGMKATKGSANPTKLKDIFIELLR
jgi:aspartyl-tRNA(Asn)/glutamyl-tRNA(Gln) amidotransferase subunit B